MIWNETKECMSRDEMTNLQSARLRKLAVSYTHLTLPTNREV